MTLEEKIDQLLSAVQALDTRMGFIDDDLAEIKEALVAINDTTVTMALNAATPAASSGGGGDKTARLAEFQKASARW